jgi:predicted dehydrogenase
MSEQLGVIVVGCGYWGINYVRLLSELPETKVALVVDKDPARLDKVQERFPNVPVSTDLSDALNANGVDAAVISTSANTHYQIACRCIEAGKHVLIEKPMTTTSEDARSLIDVAASMNVKLMVGHIFMFNAGVRKVKSYIVQGKIGQVYYLYSQRTNLGPIRTDVNAMWDLATHDVSIFNYLLDSTPEWVSAIGLQVLQPCCEDVGFMTLGYPDNRLAHIHVSWADPNKVRELVVVGSNQRVAFNDLNPLEMVRVFEKGVSSSAEADISTFGEYKFAIRDGDIISPHINNLEPLKAQVLHFVECIREDRTPISDGLNGLEVVRVVEAANQSIEYNGSPVSLIS